MRNVHVKSEYFPNQKRDWFDEYIDLGFVEDFLCVESVFKRISSRSAQPISGGRHVCAAPEEKEKESDVA